MYDGPGGMTVSADERGRLIISNGVQTQTLSGTKIKISGSAGVSVPKTIGTGPRQADGSVVVLAPNGTVTGNDPFGTLGHEIGSFAGHLDPRPGFVGHVETQTSTVQQQ